MRILAAALAELFRQLFADMRMRFGDIGGGRRQAGADRPHRLIGDDGVGRRGAWRHRAGDLARQHVERRARLALGPRLADADDGHEPGAPGGFGLGLDGRIVLAMRWSRRSEWPTMTWLAPASFSISAEMSPV